MEKPAHNDHPIHDLIRTRWSVRAFNDQPIPDDVLLSVLEAARWSPSSRNAQPWRFVVARKADNDLYSSLFECLGGNNRRWAGGAPVLILAVAENVTEDDRQNAYADHDLGLASALMMLQAQAHGLYTHPMAGFDKDMARDSLNIPENYAPRVIWAMGYRGDVDSLPDDLREREQRPRERKPLAEIVFGSIWGETAPFVNGQ